MTVLVGKVPARHAILEMRVRDMTELLERLEVPVHRRRIDLGVLPPDARGDLLGRGVMAGALERLHHHPPLHGHALAARAYPRVDVHTATVSRQRAMCNRPLLRRVAISPLAR